MFGSLLGMDRALGVWVASALAGPWLDRVMVFVSVIGARGAVWIVLALGTAVIAPAKRMAAWRLLLALALTGLLVDHVAKPIVGRLRPFVDHPEYREIGVRPGDSSFPSGHAGTAAAGALAFARMMPGAAIPAGALALLIGTSRVALGVHFPSDVIAGFLIGYLCARFCCARAPRDDLGVSAPAS